MTPPQVAVLCDFLMDESAPVADRAEALEILSRRGETPSEVAEFVRVLLSKANRLAITTDRPMIDLCGTGGDRLGLFNVSTAAMFVVAGAGACVVKHGNRGITSRCGGADVLEALGIRIDLDPFKAAQTAADVGCVFLFAPNYHPAFRTIAPVRRLLAERGIPTVFNKLGPLLNPANPPFQLAGVFERTLVDLYADVFGMLGRRCAWAVHGETPEGGLDEMSTLGSTHVAEVKGDRRKNYTLDPSDHQLATPVLDDLRGGSAAENALRLEALLRGRLSGPIEDIVLWNSAGALVVAGLVPDLESGLDAARTSLHRGEAAARLDALRANA